MATPTTSASVDPSTNRLAGAGVAYDDAGNMTAHPFITPGSGSMTYDANNKMTNFIATGVAVSTKYDAARRRVRKTVNTETTVWVYDVRGALVAEYVTQQSATTAGVYYRTMDHLGSTRVVTDALGSVKQRRDYFPFGETIDASSSLGGRQLIVDDGVATTYNASLTIRQQFTGQQRDAETGLDYFWERCFCAEMARFFSVDPANAGVRRINPQSWNAYGYVSNNPLRAVDPDGLQEKIVLPTETVTVTATPLPIVEVIFIDIHEYEGIFNEETLLVLEEQKEEGEAAEAAIEKALGSLPSAEDFSKECRDFLKKISPGVTIEGMLEGLKRGVYADGIRSGRDGFSAEYTDKHFEVTDGVIYFNYDWVNSQATSQLVATLLHESMHTESGGAVHDIAIMYQLGILGDGTEFSNEEAWTLWKRAIDTNSSELFDAVVGTFHKDTDRITKALFQGSGICVPTGNLQ